MKQGQEAVSFSVSKPFNLNAQINHTTHQLLVSVIVVFTLICELKISNKSGFSYRRCEVTKLKNALSVVEQCCQVGGNHAWLIYMANSTTL